MFLAAPAAGGKAWEYELARLSWPGLLPQSNFTRLCDEFFGPAPSISTHLPHWLSLVKQEN